MCELTAPQVSVEVAAGREVAGVQVDRPERLCGTLRARVHLIRRRVRRPLHMPAPKLTRTFSDGHYGLYLDETLTDGSSARCPTFDNEPLCSPGPRQGEGVTFECVGLEVWGIGG